VLGIRNWQPPPASSWWPSLNTRKLTLFLLPLTGLHFGFNVTFGDVFLFLLIAQDFPRFQISSKPLTLTFWSMATLVALGSVVAGLRGTFVGEWVDAVQVVFLLGVVLPLGWCVCRDMSLRQIATPVVLSGCLQSVVAIVQIFDSGFRWFTQRTYGLGEFGHRPLGLTGNPNALALILSWTIPLAVFLALRSTNRRDHWLWTASVFLCSVGAIVSFSKTSLVSVPLALLGSLLLVSGRKRAFVVFGAAFVAAIVFFFAPALQWFLDVLSYRFGATDSFDQRFGTVVGAWQNLQEWIWLGVGSGSDIVYGERNNQIHNQIIGMAVQFGLPVALLLVSSKVIMVVECARQWRLASARILGLVLVVSNVIMLVHPPYWVRGYYLPVFFVMAMIAGRISDPTGISGNDNHDG
jgi:O-Antigen ligase